ncbi:arylesterase [Neisseria sp.]|uniref:arylesterase n=1 Tax=Neisseria sp. TaxID=192066 RepID=UPI0035A0056E
MNRSRRTFLKYTAALLLAACGSGGKNQKLPDNAAILALGDSLTEGYGAAKGADYPTQLAEITGRKLINGGVSGNTSAQALARLPALLRQQPALVLVCIGGNDFLRRLPERETRANIGKIIATVQKAGSSAVLVAVPHFTTGALFGNLSDHPMYRELAQQYRIPLLENVWSEILGDPDLKSDTIHANAEGYRQMAEETAAFLRGQGFLG